MLLKRSQRRIEAATISSLQNQTAGAEVREEEVPASPEEPEVRTGSPSLQQEPVSAIIPPPVAVLEPRPGGTIWPCALPGQWL